MARIFISPSKYIQAPGELQNIGDHTSVYGTKALVLISAGGEKRFGSQIEASFRKSGISFLFERFNGECCDTEINRITEIVKKEGCDVVAGIGGGKIFDTAKAVANNVALPVIICPTIASTDAPCSALSVIYTDDGTFDRYAFFKQNPNIVIMDSDIIAHSPVRLTVAGMGDALATYFEARACLRSGATTCAAGKVTNAAMGIARLCYDTLMEEGIKAKSALDAGARTEAVEKIIEANTLLSGIGFESGGLAGAHALHNGFTILPECHKIYHGEKVAFGTLTQLILEDVSKEELDRHYAWCEALGLPVTLAQLGITDPTWEKIHLVAETACAESDTLHNMPFEINPDIVTNAIFAADSYGRKFH